MEFAVTKWHPIADYLPGEAQQLADKELAALSSVWIEQQSKLASSANIRRFDERLRREWAIETGLIERLYTLDRGITELMIERGLNAALIPHSSNGDPERTVAIVVDQQSAIDSVFDFVKGARPLSTSYIKELHSLFTRHQPYTEGRDQFGRKRRVELRRGDYKRGPNNPTRPDGSVHEYCPPEHVAAEVDRLVQWHLAHEEAAPEVAPEVEAAWLHHRFAQIHPFEDGNGRLARALATLVFVKHRWLPLVVKDSARGKYIEALEAADQGDLRHLVGFFAGLQRQQFIKALGIAHDVELAGRVDARIHGIKQRLAKRRRALEREWQSAIKNASRLHDFAHERMETVRSMLADALANYGEFSFFVDQCSDAEPRSYYFQRQIVATARELGYYANPRHYRSWVRLVAKDGSQAEMLVSFHCIGQQFQGVLACSATWFRRVPTDDGTKETEGTTSLTDNVFQINYKEDPTDIESRFEAWLEAAIERGLALWEGSTL